jgi:eukaryotic-like serine/threonine-protein kinase
MSDGPPGPVRLPPRPDHRIAGRYELIEIAGRGGMAVVWRAVHHGPGRFRRKVAVKQMYPHLAELEQYRHLFEEEGRVGSLLQDPNIAQVLDFVLDHDTYYLVMEWVSGVDLATYIRYRRQIARPSPWALVAAVGIGVLRGLHAAHERLIDMREREPIVHRDVSPHNILISDQGRAKLIDFGLSFARDRDIENTDPGMAKGKLAYLAPEVVRGGRPTPLTDQFATGTVLWEALSSRRAFDGSSDLETYRKVANAEVVPLAELRPDIPEELCALVHRALSLDPSDRFHDTGEMAWSLGEVLKGHEATEDLYAVLSREVLAARTKLGMGERTQDHAAESAISELNSGLVELLVDEDDRPSGFRKWIPAFIRNITG